MVYKASKWKENVEKTVQKTKLNERNEKNLTTELTMFKTYKHQHTKKNKNTMNIELMGRTTIRKINNNNGTMEQKRKIWHCAHGENFFLLETNNQKTKHKNPTGKNHSAQLCFDIVGSGQHNILYWDWSINIWNISKEKKYQQSPFFHDQEPKE